MMTKQVIDNQIELIATCTGNPLLRIGMYQLYSPIIVKTKPVSGDLQMNLVQVNTDYLADWK